MEKREEIKDGVKNRIIEFMAEQITKEESFAELKNELIEELLGHKETKTRIINSSIGRLFDNNFVPTHLKNRFEEREHISKKISAVKSGFNPVKLRDFMNNVLETDSTTYKQLEEILENKNFGEEYKPEFLKYNHSAESLVNIRKESLEIINNLVENPIDDCFGSFEVRSYVNGGNYYKTYSLENKLRKFYFSCSFVHNNLTGENLIDKLSTDLSGYVVTNEDLGITFAIQAMELLDKAESKRQEINAFTSKKQNEKEFETLRDLLNPEGKLKDSAAPPFSDDYIQ